MYRTVGSVGNFCEWHRKMHLSAQREKLFPDAETGEDTTQKIVGGEVASDVIETILGASQIFGEKFASGVGGQLGLTFKKIVAGFFQGIQVAATGAETAFQRRGES